MIAARDYIIDALDSIDIDLDRKKIYVIWSFGTIDIRCSIHELMVRKLIEGDRDIKNHTGNALESIKSNVIEVVEKNLSARYSSASVVNCFQAASNSFFVGENPKTVKEVRALRKNKYVFPAFGSIETRKYYANIFNLTVRSWCDENRYVYNDPYFDTTNRHNLIYMRDSAHLTDPTAIADNANELIRKARVLYA
jgi:hypothetical protein